MRHRSPRVIVLWFAAIAVAVTTTVVVASDLATLHRHAHDLGPERRAVIARHDLPLGTTITGGDVATRTIHSSQLPPGVEHSPEQVIGRVVQTPVLRAGFIATRNLAPTSRTGLDGVIPPGLRALRVVATDALRPRTGAVVDLLASYPDSTRSAGDAGATVVAHGVVVLRTDLDAHTTTGTSAVGVTVLVTAQQARDLAAASSRGTITLTLVPPEEALD